MIFKEQTIPGVFLIEPESFTDERGILRRHFCQKEYARHGLNTSVAQANISENHHRHTLRGFHTYGDDKTLSCIKGTIYDIVVDIRPDSPGYLKWVAFVINSESRNSLYVPTGCANAFLTLEDDTWIHYYHSTFYDPGRECCIRYNDPLFGFTWPVEPAIVSPKDRNHHNYIPIKPL